MDGVAARTEQSARRKPAVCDLTVVIPAFNEGRDIGPTLEKVAAYLGSCGTAYEVIVVDDGSTDRTAAVVKDFGRADPTIRLIESAHAGKGGAIRRGVLEARGRHILFMDADYSTRIEEWAQCLPWLTGGFDIVIGSRKIPGATVTVRQHPLREAMGKVFTWLVNMWLGTRVSDVTCGFKCFTAEAARGIFRLQRVNGWGFDAEILFLARRLGLRLKEVPVMWANDATTNVRLARDASRSFLELVNIRLSAWRGRYPRMTRGGRDT